MLPQAVALLCPICGNPIGRESFCACGHTISCSGAVVDLLGAAPDATAEHYTVQWGAELGFAEFARDNPAAMAVTPGRQLGWDDLLSRIRARAMEKPATVLDAACGFGGILDVLGAEPAPAALTYVGFDIHHSLAEIRVPHALRTEQVTLLRWDMSRPLPLETSFDFVICRASLHHTPDPRCSFANLVDKLHEGRTIAISVYAKKGRPREAVDTVLRDEISRMTAANAFALAEEFTRLGRDLQASSGMIEIIEDLPFLGIKAGRHNVQELIYGYFIKCWFDPNFGKRYSALVNFDWYHPPYACRYEPHEVAEWFTAEGVQVTRSVSIKAQHYFEARSADEAHRTHIR